MPDLTFPEAEAALVRACYARSRVILEYGTGGSTRFASGLPDSYVIGAETDRDQAIRLQAQIDASNWASPTVVHHQDIGRDSLEETSVQEGHGELFHPYPFEIWRESFFRHPDLVLINGRFRPACLLAVTLLIERPVTVLFADYPDHVHRPLVEQVVAPEAVIDRMARFELEPGAVRPDRFHDYMARLSRLASPPADGVPYHPLAQAAEKGPIHAGDGT